MSRYVYSCGKCRKDFEIEKSMTLSGRTEVCPTCGEQGQRKFTPPALPGKDGAGHSGPEPSGGCEGCCSSGTCGLN